MGTLVVVREDERLFWFAGEPGEEQYIVSAPSIDEAKQKIADLGKKFDRYAPLRGPGDGLPLGVWILLDAPDDDESDANGLRSRLALTERPVDRRARDAELNGDLRDGVQPLAVVSSYI